MNNTARLNFIKHLLYVFLILIFYVLQSIPELLVISGVKPIWVVPAAIAISMFEGEFAGGIYGALAGLLCDTGSFLLFGFNGFVVTVFCIISGLLVFYLMRCNMFTYLLFVLVTLALRGSIEYFFAYGMWNHKDAWMIYTNSTIPTAIYSTIAAVPVFWLVRRIYRRFASYGEDSYD